MLCKIMDCYWANFIRKKTLYYRTACYSSLSFSMKSWNMNITFLLFILNTQCAMQFASCSVSTPSGAEITDTMYV